MRRELAYLIILLAFLGIAALVLLRRTHRRGDETGHSLRIDLFKDKDEGEGPKGT